MLMNSSTTFTLSMRRARGLTLSPLFSGAGAVRSRVPVSALSSPSGTRTGIETAAKGAVVTNANPVRVVANPIQYEISEDSKSVELQPDRLPKHVMVVLDGTRRSCKKNGIELTYEHFYQRYIQFADLCIELGIPAATFSVFATCTWKRTDFEADLIFSQFQESMEENLEKFMRQGIRVSVSGEKWTLPRSLQDTIEKVEEATKNGDRLHVIYQLSYGARWDILESARIISKKVMDGEIKVENVDEALVEQHLWTSRIMSMTNNAPNPDLMIRCGGKQRFSNFYLWQVAYAELYISDLLLCDFGEDQFLDAVRWFQQRARRFGK